MKEVIKEEHAFNKRKQAFDDEHQKLVIQNDLLQEELDKYCIEKDTFDREAQKVKEKGEQDQIESEKIGYFKANKDRLKDELRKLKQDIESEKQQLREDKIRLEIFKNELNTKQKTIETLRYNYIKSDQQSVLDRAEAISQAKSTVIPIKPPTHETVQMKLPRMPESTAPRFSYEDYMKSLSDKIQGNAPNTVAYIGADFQAYLLREREQYLKSVHELQREVPSIHVRAPRQQPYSPSPIYGNRHSQSVNSLHYMSAGLSSDRD